MLRNQPVNPAFLKDILPSYPVLWSVGPVWERGFMKRICLTIWII